MATIIKGEQPMVLGARFADYDLCDFVTFTLAGIAFVLCLYAVV